MGISTIGRMFRGALVGALAFALAPMVAAEQVRSLKPVKAPANNEQRLALVIGNSAYKSSPLRNPVNDARAMAQALSETGFQVTLIEDAGRATMRRVIRDWGDQLARGGVGLFYFAGHGMQIRGRNYLIPVTADVQREDEVEDESVDVNTVLSKMESAKNMLNLVILDACRNNPFQRAFRSASQGLAQMDAPTGTLISFATAPGSVAADGSGENGLYTSYLLKAIRTPGLPIEQLFKQVRIGVTKDTADKQVPWESSSLRGDFFFLPPVPGSQLNRADVDKAVQEATKAAEARAAQERTALQSAMEKMIADALAKQKAQLDAERKGAAAAPAPAPAPAPARTDDRQIELAFWDSIKGSTNAADFTAYLERYPQGSFAPIARNRVQQMTASAEPKVPSAQKPAPAAAPVPAPTAPTQVASIAPAATVAAPAGGDRWQYAGADANNSSRSYELLIEQQGRSAAGTLEKFQPKGGAASPWVYTAVPTLVGQANGWAMFSPLVTGEDLRVGKTWSGITIEQIGRCGSGLWTCQGQARVAGQERVTVKAGAFEALKVVVEVTVRIPPWTSPISREITYWYAADVGRIVRMSTRTFGTTMGAGLTDPDVNYELVAFRHADGKSSGTIDAALASAGTPGAAAPILVASASPTRGVVQMQGPAIPKVGDRWEYELKDLATDRWTRTVIDIASVGLEGIVENVAVGTAAPVSLQHGPGNYVTGAAIVQISPYLLSFTSVDGAGKAGDATTTRFTDCEGVRTCRVVVSARGTERISVAGTSVEAERLDVTIIGINQGATNIGKNFHVEFKAWYAREVRRLVRLEGRSAGSWVLMPNFDLILKSFKLQ